MESQGATTISNEYYEIEFLLQSNSIQVYKNIFNDAIFQVFIKTKKLRFFIRNEKYQNINFI